MYKPQLLLISGEIEKGPISIKIPIKIVLTSGWVLLNPGFQVIAVIILNRGSYYSPFFNSEASLLGTSRFSVIS